MDEKRTIDGYAVLHAIRIDGAEQIVAEKDSHYRLYRGEALLHRCSNPSCSNRLGYKKGDAAKT